MRKFKFLTVILTFMVFLGAFAACNQGDSSSSQEPTSTHTCESVCEECGKCLDEDCTDEACEEKCEGHTVDPEPEPEPEPEPAHTCESVCPTCNKCLDADCTETACADKCEGHTVTPDPEPAHTCESVCPTCNKCLDADCTETACADKCEGHTVTPDPEPAHTCESVCPTCNKCLDADCTETACADKCEGHTVTPEHTCESVCPTCNKCLDADCTETACADKCEGHTVTPDPEPAHTCESVCPTCNKCLDAECTETACADKCEGHVVEPAHTCESVCPTCSKCLDAECTEEACEEKCPGHVVIPEHECESVCAKCGMCQDAACTEKACKYKCPGHDIAADSWDMYDLKVVSFNVTIPNSDGVSWTARRDESVAFLNNSGAHIIGLQECSQSPRTWYLANLVEKYELIHFNENSANIAMVYDKTVFNLVAQEIYWLSDTPDKVSNGWDAGNYRAAGVLYLQHIATGEMVKAINTHGPLDDEGNTKAFNLIAERSLSSDTPMFTVMTGDFNARPDPVASGRPNELGYKIIEEKLQDTRVAAAESPCRWHTTWCGWDEATKESHESTAQLDHIFVTRSEDVEVLTYQVHYEDQGNLQYISDHYPIASTIRIYNPALSWTEFY